MPPPLDDPAAGAPDPTRVGAMRQLFWENVVREMLTGLAMMSESQPAMFDGRLAVLTNAGERIPIAEVAPMFACGIPGSAAEKAASIAVECTVFRIRTPVGEVYTLPLREIRGIHALSAELMQSLLNEAGKQAGDDEEGENTPFGLAAFRSIASPPPPSNDVGAI